MQDYKVVVIFKSRLEIYKECMEKYTRISPTRIKSSYDLWYNISYDISCRCSELIIE